MPPLRGLASSEAHHEQQCIQDSLESHLLLEDLRALGLLRLERLLEGVDLGPGALDHLGQLRLQQRHQQERAAVAAEEALQALLKKGGKSAPRYRSRLVVLKLDKKC